MTSTDTACICAKVRRAARTLTTLYDDALEPAGLTTAQLTLLSTLAKRGPLSLSEFARRTGHDRSTLNRSIRPLIARAEIARLPSDDRREHVFGVTQKGREAIARCTQQWKIAQARVSEILGEDSGTLLALLDRLEELRA